MINTKLKKLSLLLILSVFIIGAVSAVSAENVGTSQATANPTGTTDAIQEANTAEGPVAGYIVTDGPSNGTGGTVPTGTGVNNGTLVFDGNIYTANGTLVSSNSVDKTSSLNFNQGSTAGIYAGLLKVTDITGLTNGNTYYAGLTLTNGKATYEPVPGTIYESNIGTLIGTEYVAKLYIPFTYYSKYIINITDKVVSYGEAWNYTGTISNKEGLVPVGVVNITFTKGTDTISAVVPFLNGAFTLSSTNGAFSSLSTGAYVVTATYDSIYSNTANFYVTGQNITINPSLNNSNAYYNDPSTVTVTLTDSNGNLFTDTTTITYTIINLNTGVRTTLSGVTSNGTDSQILNGLLPGSYVIRINAINSNFNFAQVDVYYTVTAVPTTISVSENPIVVIKNSNGTVTIKVKDNNGNDLDVENTNINVMLFDSTNVPKTTVQHPDANDQYTVSNAIAVTGDYLKISFSKTGYTSSELNVPIVVKNGTRLVVAPTSTTFTYGGNQTIVVQLFPDDGKSLNTTVNLILNDTTVATIPLTNGVGSYALQNLNLEADDDAYVFTVQYPGDDSYRESEGNLTVKVNPIYELGLLRTNTTVATYNVTSTQTIKFNLSSLSNVNTLIPYNGPLTYTINDNNYNITMVNGEATIAIADLEELTAGNNNYMFKILGNNRSNQVPVVIVVYTLDGKINANNITAKNDRNFNVTGTITNAADGYVTVILSDANGNEISTYVTEVNKDGSFNAQFTPLPDGNYTAEIIYTNGVIGVSNPDDLDETIAILVNGSEGPTPTPTPTNNTYNTILTIDPFSEVVDAGKNLTGRLLTEDGTPVVGMHILLNLTRLSNGQSKVYYTTTDYLGEFQFPINLAVGNYTAYATFGGVTIPTTNITYNPTASNITPFYVLSNGTEPVNPNTTNASSVIITATPYVGTVSSPGNFTVKFTLADGTPIIGVRDVIEITLTRTSSGASKTYTWFVPDYRGEVSLPIELGAGTYSAHIVYKGSTVPIVTDPATADSTITVIG